ncbi:hypothetical protein PYW08_011492 [Mythimna loreyi]|uniref:Uncharacterized protein n=1 Tax=Mythimna loreyi TaxID=667449 RepID=A0ACC2QLN7_9NEOP|nr:hypothetical protein PYW08_011492 [Mythimna loreyi]
MNESSEVLRTKWKDLNDSYKKYQKQAEEFPEGKSTNSSTYHKWCWAENLQFLESFDYKRSKTSSRVKINSASLHDCSLDSELPIQLVSTTSIPTNPPQESEVVYLESLETLAKDAEPEPMPVRKPISTTAVSESARLLEPNKSVKWRSSTAKRSYSKTSDEGDRVHFKRLKFVERSQAADLLFQSYAETFKSFSAKKQVLLKVKLAKLFADAEMDEINEPSVVFSSASVADEHDYAFGGGIDLETMKHSPDSDISSID